MIDERLTFHSFISSDKRNKSLRVLESSDIQRGDIVIFDEKIIFSDDTPDDKPLNSIVVIEFKQPGRSKYKEGENPVLQAANVIKAIDQKSVVEGKSVSVRVDLCGRRIITNKTTHKSNNTSSNE